MPKPTYKQARERILDALIARGWTVKREKAHGGPMKVPWAKPPSGGVVVYLRPQAIHAGLEGAPQSSARSIDHAGTGPDLRELCDRAPSAIAEHIEAAARKTVRAL